MVNRTSIRCSTGSILLARFLAVVAFINYLAKIETNPKISLLLCTKRVSEWASENSEQTRTREEEFDLRMENI